VVSAKKPKATAEQLANRKVWVKALRSGTFKKGLGELGSAKNGYCCLGVGAKVTGTKFNPGHSHSQVFSDRVGLREDNGQFVLTKKLIKIIAPYGDVANGNVPGSFARYHVAGDGSSLVELNDCILVPFDVIGDIIESEPKGLFI